MPQPLSMVVPNPSVAVYAEAALRHPDRAAQVASVFAWFAALESQIGLIFAILMGAPHSKQVLAVYHSINSFEARIGAVSTIIDRSLTKQQSDLFRAVKRATFKPAQASRNKLAHWVWAECSELPDAICLINPAELLDFYSDILNTSTFVRRTSPIQKLDMSKILVYRKKDLEDIENQITKSAHYSTKVCWLHSHDRDATTQLTI